jgi:hypothetical protein
MELRKDRKQRFQRRSLVRSLELHRNRIRKVPFQRHSLGLRHMLELRKGCMLSQRHSLVHKLICKKACSSDRKA